MVVTWMSFRLCFMSLFLEFYFAVSLFLVWMILCFVLQWILRVKKKKKGSHIYSRNFQDRSGYSLFPFVFVSLFYEKIHKIFLMFMLLENTNKNVEVIIYFNKLNAFTSQKLENEQLIFLKNVLFTFGLENHYSESRTMLIISQKFAMYIELMNTDKKDWFIIQANWMDSLLFFCFN